MRARSFAAELIGSSQLIHDRCFSPYAGVGRIKCIQNGVSLMLFTHPLVKLNFDKW